MRIRRDVSTTVVRFHSLFGKLKWNISKHRCWNPLIVSSKSNRCNTGKYKMCDFTIKAYWGWWPHFITVTSATIHFIPPGMCVSVRVWHVMGPKCLGITLWCACQIHLSSHTTDQCGSAVSALPAEVWGKQHRKQVTTPWSQIHIKKYYPVGVLCWTGDWLFL